MMLKIVIASSFSERWKLFLRPVQSDIMHCIQSLALVTVFMKKSDFKGRMASPSYLDPSTDILMVMIFPDHLKMKHRSQCFMVMIVYDDVFTSR